MYSWRVFGLWPLGFQISDLRFQIWRWSVETVLRSPEIAGGEPACPELAEWAEPVERGERGRSSAERSRASCAAKATMPARTRAGTITATTVKKNIIMGPEVAMCMGVFGLWPFGFQILDLKFQSWESGVRTWMLGVECSMLDLSSEALAKEDVRARHSR